MSDQVAAVSKPIVFVSFAHADEAEFVTGPLAKLHRTCEGEYSFFIAKDVPSNEWEAKITAAIKTAKVLLYFMTTKSLQSKRTMDEIGLAKDFGVTIIPLVCEKDCEKQIDDLLTARLVGVELVMAHQMSAQEIYENVRARLPAVAPPTRTLPAGPVRLLQIGQGTIGMGTEPSDSIPFTVTRLQRATVEHLLEVMEERSTRGASAAFAQAASLLGMHLWSIALDNIIGHRLIGEDTDESGHVELQFLPESKLDWWPWELTYEWRPGAGGSFVGIDRSRTFTRKPPSTSPVLVQPRPVDRRWKVLFAAPRTPEKELDPTPLYEVFGVGTPATSPGWTASSDGKPLVDLATRTEHSPTQNEISSDQCVSWEEVLSLVTKGDPVDILHVVTFARLTDDGKIELAFADPDSERDAKWIDISALSSALGGDAERGKNPIALIVVSFVAVGENPWRLAVRMGEALATDRLPAVMTVPYRASSDRSAQFFRTFYTQLFEDHSDRAIPERLPGVLRHCHRSQRESGGGELHPFGAPIVFLNSVQKQEEPPKTGNSKHEGHVEAGADRAEHGDGTAPAGTTSGFVG